MKYDENGNRLITGYVPKLALTGVAIAAYFLLSAWCTFQFIRSKPKPKYMLWVTIGTFTMAVGFGARIPMTDDPGSLGIYIVTTLVRLAETALTPVYASLSLRIPRAGLCASPTACDLARRRGLPVPQGPHHRASLHRVRHLHFPHPGRWRRHDSHGEVRRHRREGAFGAVLR
jgi:hypothetical protein